MRVNVRDTYQGVLEACYRNTAPEHWASEFLDRLSRSVPAAAGASLVGTSLSGGALAMHPIAAHGDASQELVELGLSSMPAFDQDSYHRTWYPHHAVATISSVQSGMSPRASEAVTSGLRQVGCADMIGVLLYPAPGEAFAVTLPISKSAGDVLPRPLKRELEEVRLHLEAAMVVRRQTNGPVAVIHTDGRVLHAQPAMNVRPVRFLGRKVRELERSLRWTSDAQDLFAAWRGLIEGRYVAVEYLDTDGLRVYFVYENAPHAALHRQLDRDERNIVELLSDHSALKDLAASLTMEDSEASVHRTRARQKMGFQSIAHLARFACTANGTASTHVPWQKLSLVLREVLSLAISGYRIDEIAALRKSKPNTVRNQLAALRRELEIHGRTGFASLAAPPV